MPKTTRTPGLESFRIVLPRYLHGLGNGVERLYYCHWVLAHWPDVVGSAIAQNVEAVRIARDTLWLYTYDASWRNQIALMKLQILQNVNNLAGRRLVKDLRFARSGAERRQLADTPMDEGVDYKRLLPKVNLTDEELAAARASVQTIEDEELRDRLFRLALKQAKKTHLEKALGYHPCADCGALCEPQRTRCPSCEQKHTEAIRTAIHRYLADIPWARYGEVKQAIPEATPMLLGSVRASYVQELAAHVLLTESGTLAAKTLTMAFRCLPPEQLNEETVRRTLWDLRNDLAKPEEWKPIKRYEYLRGEKKKK